MDYSNVQFFFTLILDGLLGIICGWSLRRWFYVERIPKTEATLRKDIALLAGRLTAANEALLREQNSAAQNCVLLREASEALRLATARLNGSEAIAANLKGAVAETQHTLAVRTRELAESQIGISEMQTAIVEKALRVTSLERRVAELEPLIPKPAATDSRWAVLRGLGMNRVSPANS
jgi:hypothetical protein